MSLTAAAPGLDRGTRTELFRTMVLAANQGTFQESLNLAALWSLPVVFMVEDDSGISVPRRASTAIGSNAERAAAYGMPGERVEDNDVEAYAAAGRAVDRSGEPSATRRGCQPTWSRWVADHQVVHCGRAHRNGAQAAPAQPPLVLEHAGATRIPLTIVLDEQPAASHRAGRAGECQPRRGSPGLVPGLPQA